MDAKEGVSKSSGGFFVFQRVSSIYLSTLHLRDVLCTVAYFVIVMVHGRESAKSKVQKRGTSEKHKSLSIVSRKIRNIILHHNKLFSSLINHLSRL